MSGHFSLLPAAVRQIRLLQMLRSGEPHEARQVAHDLEVSVVQLQRDLRVLREQGCLIDVFDGWIRMVDDHSTDSDEALERACAAIAAQQVVAHHLARLMRRNAG